MTLLSSSLSTLPVPLLSNCDHKMHNRSSACGSTSASTAPSASILLVSPE
eukprot:CAMPEP_0198223010 /NCGR_PEP_ID=MMETSP1445-20131203/90595_1 /TAXON_ID=36898 /ORGANISM="Pyramimonas sp., Strain CCMP2087" /LENGTH=49 /DNA_ID=CAMNT_0043901713 /DNA_START=250 /DNA_END=399 /DNA_ORIENTATION=+